MNEENGSILMPFRLACIKANVCSIKVLTAQKLIPFETFSLKNVMKEFNAARPFSS